MPRDENGIWPVWLTPEGVAHECGTHIEYILDWIGMDYPELLEEFREWRYNGSGEIPGGYACYQWYEDRGWWRKVNSHSPKGWVWCGSKKATPAQRRYINNDIGERQSNAFFAGVSND